MFVDFVKDFSVYTKEIRRKMQSILGTERVKTENEAQDSIIMVSEIQRRLNSQSC